MTSCGHQLITIDATTVNRREMVLQSPGYPNGYEHQLNCAWHLLSSNKAERVVLQLIDVDLEVFSSAHECLADYMQIFSSKDLKTWSKLGTLCSMSNDGNATIFYGKPYLRVDFRTDASINETGFKASVRTNCGSHIIASEGHVNITDFLVQYTIGIQECVWTL